MLRKGVKNLFAKVFKGGNTFVYDLEAWSFSLLLKKLETNAPAHENFLAQLQRVNMAQRSPDGKIVALYDMNDTYFKKWDLILLPDRRENFEAYKLEVKDFGSTLTFRLSVWFHQGRLSSIEYPAVSQNSIKNRKRCYFDNIEWTDFQTPEEVLLVKEALRLSI